MHGDTKRSGGSRSMLICTISTLFSAPVGIYPINAVFDVKKYHGMWCWLYLFCDMRYLVNLPQLRWWHSFPRHFQTKNWVKFEQSQQSNCWNDCQLSNKWTSENHLLMKVHQLNQLHETFRHIIYRGTKHLEEWLKKGGMKHLKISSFNRGYETLSL